MNQTLFKDIKSNSLRLSKFKNFKSVAQFHQLAVKFVLKGKEDYRINDKKFTVNRGEYIIGNSDQIAEVEMKEEPHCLCLIFQMKSLPK